MKFRKTIAIILFILFAALLPSALSAFSLDGIQLNAGSTVILNAEPVENSPAPATISFMSGISVPMMFSDILYFEPGLRVFGLFDYFVILDSANIPVQALRETAGWISILCFELRPEFGALFRLNDSIALGVTGAPVFTFRFPFDAEDNTVQADDKTFVTEYFFSAGRFLGFYAGGFFSWTISEDTALRLKIGTNLPVYHIWDGAEIDFYDQLMIQPELGIVFRF